MKEVAKKLARLHSTKVPIKKNKDWVMKTMDHNFEKAYKKFPIDQLIEENDCQSFKKYNLMDEINWLKKCVSATKSPICFCHNDFRGNNIMVNELDLNHNFNPISEKITFCDFENSNYGYRGSDFGTIFGEWNRDLNGYKGVQNFPEDSTIKPFISEYISESIRIDGKEYENNKINSFKQILKEIKVFTLVSSMFMLSTCLYLDPPKEVPTFTKKFLMVYKFTLCFKSSIYSILFRRSEQIFILKTIFILRTNFWKKNLLILNNYSILLLSRIELFIQNIL